MVKKFLQNCNNKNIKENKDKQNQRGNKLIKPKKFILKVTSKMKKKLKYTQNKLNIDKTKIKKVISYIIKEEPPIYKEYKDQENESIDEEIKGEGGVPIYLFITLKKDLKDDEIKLIKNKLIKLKYSMINEAIYICLIEDKLTDEEKDKLNILTNNYIDIIKKEDLKNSKKNISNINLENQYQIFISNAKNNIYLNKNLESIFYQTNKFEIIKNLVEKIYNGATLIKLVEKKNNILKIKIGYSYMNKEKLIDNAYRAILKSISYTLCNAEKYNGVENILIKTKQSIPFSIFGVINPENINNYKI